VVEANIVGDHGIGNPEGLNDLGNDGEVEDLGPYRRNWDGSPPRIVCSGVRIIKWPSIVVVKGIGLFNGEVLG